MEAMSMSRLKVSASVGMAERRGQSKWSEAREAERVLRVESMRSRSRPRAAMKKGGSRREAHGLAEGGGGVTPHHDFGQEGGVGDLEDQIKILETGGDGGGDDDLREEKGEAFELGFAGGVEEGRVRRWRRTWLG